MLTAAREAAFAMDKRQGGAEAPPDFRRGSLSSPVPLAGQRLRGPDSMPLSGTQLVYDNLSAFATMPRMTTRSGVEMLMLIGALLRREVRFTGMDSRSVETV